MRVLIITWVVHFFSVGLSGSVHSRESHLEVISHNRGDRFGIVDYVRIVSKEKVDHITASVSWSVKLLHKEVFQGEFVEGSNHLLFIGRGTTITLAADPIGMGEIKVAHHDDVWSR